MILNGSSLNSLPVNGSYNYFGTLSGNILSIEQDVELQGVIEAGSILSIEQSVRSTTSVNLLSIEQSVQSPVVNTYLSKFGFRPIITLGGGIIPDNQICGVHNIERREGNASIMTITIQPYAGTLNLFAYEGKTITYDVQTSSGITRLFTGRVNVVTLDLVDTKRVVIQCTDNREEQINAQLSSFKVNIGEYNELLNGTPKSVADEVAKRLETVPYSLDFNAYGNFTYTPWAAKATADVSLAANQIYYDKPTVVFAPRHTLTNQIDITLDYRYPRLHHKVVSVNWTYPFAVCQFLLEGHSMASRAAIEAAAKSTGWVVEKPITYAEIFASGWYNCSGGVRGWSTVQASGTTIPKTELNTTTGQNVPVLDSSGNQVMTGVLTKYTDNTKLYCNGAYMFLSKRFAQTIRETYTISVTAPQSINQYGPVVVNDTASVDTNYDTAVWEQYNAGTNKLASYWTNQEPNITDFQTVAKLAIAKARNTILQAHRQTYVEFRIPGLPGIDLSHTMQITTTPLTCKGKVRSIKHVLNIEEGEYSTELELAISRSIGSQSDSATVSPTRITDNPSVSNGFVTLQSHYGEDPTLPSSARWNGMIGNKVIATTANLSYLSIYGNYEYNRTTYPESFVIDLPAIDDQFRLERNLTASQTYNYAIPNDTLTLVIT